MHTKLFECFKKDGPNGIGYEDYAGFHSTTEALSKSNFEAEIIPKFVPSIPNDFKLKLENGIRCLEIGCGAAVPSQMMAEAFPKSTFVAIDFSDEAIGRANSIANSKNLGNLQCLVEDAGKFPDNWTGSFDFVFCFDTIHDQAYPDKVLSEVFRVVKPGGQFSAVDIDMRTNVGDNIANSMSSAMYSMSLFHCMPVSLYFENGVGLGAVWGREKATEMLTNAGFELISINTCGFFNCHYACKKPNLIHCDYIDSG